MLSNEVDIDISHITLGTIADTGLVTWVKASVVIAGDFPGPEPRVLKRPETLVHHGVVLNGVLRGTMLQTL